MRKKKYAQKKLIIWETLKLGFPEALCKATSRAVKLDVGFNRAVGTPFATRWTFSLRHSPVSTYYTFKAQIMKPFDEDTS